MKNVNIKIEKICTSCKKIKKLIDFKSLTNGEDIKTCIACRKTKNIIKRKKFGWTVKDISDAKKEFDTKYKFYVLKPIISWALKKPYKNCTSCKKGQYFDQFIGNKYKMKEVNTCLKCRTYTNTTRGEEESIQQYNKLREMIELVRLMLGPCECGEDRKKVLEFDHIYPSKKTKTICALRSVNRILKEIRYCTNRCRFCHAKHSSDQRKEKFKDYKKNTISLRNQKYVTDIKIKLKECETCKRQVTKDTVMCFDFDHIDVSTKKNTISQLVAFNYSIEKIDTEINKCRLLCANCHRLVTLEQNKKPNKKYGLSDKLKYERINDELNDMKYKKMYEYLKTYHANKIKNEQIENKTYINNGRLVKIV